MIKKANGFGLAELFFIYIIVYFIPSCGTAPHVRAHFVSPSGSASWAQSFHIQTPCSVPTAFSNAHAGDTIYFRGGTYRSPKRNFGDSYSGYYNVAHSGKPGNLIVFMAYPSETPIFIGTAGGTGDRTSGSSNIYATIFGTNNQSYIVFDGFSFQADSGKKMARMMVGIGHTDAIQWQGHIVIKNCSFYGGTVQNASGDNNEGLRIEGNNFVTVSNCKFTQYYNSIQDRNTSGIKMYWDTSCVINNCEFDSSTVGCFVKEANPRTTVCNCFFKGNYLAFYMGAGIPNHAESDSLKFYNNIVINSSYIGFYWEGAGTDSGVTNNDYIIYNNTLYGNNINAQFGFAIFGHGPEFYNNILAGSTGSYNLITDDYNVYWQSHLKQLDHNQWGMPWKTIWIGENVRNTFYSSLASWKSSGILDVAYDAGCGSNTNPGCGDLASNPLFVNSSGKFDQVTDFKLKSNSPCIKKGRNGLDAIGANIDSIILRK